MHHRYAFLQEVERGGAFKSERDRLRGRTTSLSYRLSAVSIQPRGIAFGSTCLRLHQVLPDPYGEPFWNIRTGFQNGLVFQSGEEGSHPLAKGGRYWVFVYLFAKKDRANIDDEELVSFRALAGLYARKTDADIAKEVHFKELVEICRD
jgi:hypothetical protein